MRLHIPFSTGFRRNIVAGAGTAIGPPDAFPCRHNRFFPHIDTRTLERDLGRRCGAMETIMLVESRGLEERTREQVYRVQQGLGRETAMLVIIRAALGVLERWDLGAAAVLKGKYFVEILYEECRIQYAKRGASALSLEIANFGRLSSLSTKY